MADDKDVNAGKGGEQAQGGTPSEQPKTPVNGEQVLQNQAAPAAGAAAPTPPAAPAPAAAAATPSATPNAGQTSQTQSAPSQPATPAAQPAPATESAGFKYAADARKPWVPSNVDDKNKIEAAQKNLETARNNPSPTATPEQAAATVSEMEKGVKEAKEAAWKNAGFMEKTGEKIAQNWSHSGTGMKVARVGGTALGAFGVMKGLKTIFFAPEPVEGQEAPSFGSRLVKGAAWTAAGVGLALVSLVKGGQVHALRP